MAYCNLADAKELQCFGYNLGMGMDLVKLRHIPCEQVWFVTDSYGIISVQLLN